MAAEPAASRAPCACVICVACHRCRLLPHALSRPCRYKPWRADSDPDNVLFCRCSPPCATESIPRHALVSLHIHDPAFYPYANTADAGSSYGSVGNPSAPNIVNVAVPPHTDAATFRQLFATIVEKVTAFQPSILFISGAVSPPR
jgi:hypothetical protein